MRRACNFEAVDNIPDACSPRENFEASGHPHQQAIENHVMVWLMNQSTVQQTTLHCTDDHSSVANIAWLGLRAQMSALTCIEARLLNSRQLHQLMQVSGASGARSLASEESAPGAIPQTYPAPRLLLCCLACIGMFLELYYCRADAPSTNDPRHPTRIFGFIVAFTRLGPRSPRAFPFAGPTEASTQGRSHQRAVPPRLQILKVMSLLSLHTSGSCLSFPYPL